MADDDDIFQGFDDEFFVDIPPQSLSLHKGHSLTATAA